MKNKPPPLETIKIYLKNAKRRIHSAKVLLKAKEYNDAVSRAYYAFFDAASAALLKEGLSAKTHHGLILLFDKYFIKTKKMPLKIGRWLSRAKEAREEADYEVRKEFTKDYTEEVIKEAEEFVDAVGKMLKLK